MSTTGSILSKGSVFDGKIKASDSVRIEGNFTGEVTSDDVIEVGEAGVVQGDLTAKHIITAGRINGAVNAAEKVELKGTSRLEGDLVTMRLVIEDGAQFEGKCSMGNKPKEQPVTSAKVEKPTTNQAPAVAHAKQDQTDPSKKSSLFGR
jgi:cytoskeletal protein CcmA (bactofilin family)